MAAAPVAKMLTKNNTSLLSCAQISVLTIVNFLSDCSYDSSRLLILVDDESTAFTSSSSFWDNNDDKEPQNAFMLINSLDKQGANSSTALLNQLTQTKVHGIVHLRNNLQAEQGLYRATRFAPNFFLSCDLNAGKSEVKLFVNHLRVAALCQKYKVDCFGVDKASISNLHRERIHGDEVRENSVVLLKHVKRKILVLNNSGLYVFSVSSLQYIYKDSPFHTFFQLLTAKSEYNLIHKI